jgi:YVTN family beta-propeller protein
LVLANDTLVPGNFVAPEAAGPWAVTVDAAVGELFVADSSSNEVQVVSIASGLITSTIPVGSAPVSLAYDARTGEVWVANSESHDVSVISVANASVVATVDVAADPSYLLYDPGNDEIFVSNLASGNVTVINGTTDAVGAWIQGFNDPEGMAYDNEQGEVFVADYGTDELSVVSCVTDRVVGNVSLTIIPTAIAFDTTLDQIFAPNDGANLPNGVGPTNMTVISASTLTIVGTISLGGAAQAVAFDNRSGDVYVAESTANQVAVVSGQNDRVVTNLTAGYSPQGLVYDSIAREIFVLNSESEDLTVISDVTDIVNRTIGLLASPYGSAYDSASGVLFVANTFSDTVLELSTSTNSIVGTIPVQGFPIAVLYDNDTDEIFVADLQSNDVTVISGTNGSVLTNVQVGAEPVALSYDSSLGRVFVANYLSANVSVISDATNSVVGTVAVGLAPDSLTFDSANGDIYVAHLWNQTSSSTNGTITAIFAGTDQIVGNITGVGGSVLGLVYDETTGNLYAGSVAGYGPSNVKVISPNRDRVLANVSVEFDSGVLTYVNSTGEILVASGSEDAVTAISDTTNAAVAQVSVGWEPSAMTWIPEIDRVYVSDTGSGTVSILSSGAPPPNVSYPVTFTESGLPSNSNWSVTVNGTSWLAISSSVTFPATNGSYSYSIDNSESSYSASPDVGEFLMNGAAVSLNVTFVVQTFSIIFMETDLPNGTKWSVYLTGGDTGVESNSVGNQNDFEVVNGSYFYSVRSSNSQYTTAESAGRVEVSGTGQTVSISFYLVAYQLSFTETGLTPGTLWSVVGSAYDVSSHLPTLSFEVPNGTYTFTVSQIRGYDLTYDGLVTVAGAGTSVPVLFVPIYSASFTETGLPLGTNWSVTLGARSLTSMGTTISFVLPQGSYPFAIIPILNYTISPASGITLVTDSNVDVGILFSPLVPPTFPVMFEESGLAAGVVWSVSLGGTAVTSNSTSLGFQEPNGTYVYAVAPVVGYTSDLESGGISLVGQPIHITVLFTMNPLTSVGGGGLGLTIEWLAIGAVIALAGVAIGWSLRRGERESTRGKSAQGPRAPPARQGLGEETRSEPNAARWNQPKS